MWAAFYGVHSRKRNCSSLFPKGGRLALIVVFRLLLNGLWQDRNFFFFVTVTLLDVLK